MATTSTLYDRDFYAWANEQAGLLRSGRLAQADIAHIAEEIESMGKTEKRELTNRLAVLLAHLLKWEFQPAGRSMSWRLTILEQRRQVIDVLEDNPSLKPQLPAAMEKAYRLAVLAAGRETNLGTDIFPATCPWTFGQATDDDFWPE